MAKKQRNLLKAIWYFAYLIIIGPFLFILSLEWGTKGALPDWFVWMLAIAVGGYWLYILSDIREKENIGNKTTYVKIRN